MMKAVNSEVLELTLRTTIADIQEHRTKEAVLILEAVIDMLHRCKEVKTCTQEAKNQELLTKLNQLIPSSTPEDTGDPSQTSPHSLSTI